jgi:hypothetical protein
MSVGQQEDNVGAEADFGLGMPPEVVQQGLAFVAVQGDTGFHGLVSMVFRPCQVPFTIEPSLLCCQTQQDIKTQYSFRFPYCVELFSRTADTRPLVGEGGLTPAGKVYVFGALVVPQ